MRLLRGMMFAAALGVALPASEPAFAKKGDASDVKKAKAKKSAASLHDHSSSR